MNALITTTPKFMEKNKTAVEWLVSHLNKQEWFTYKQREYIEQAKKMEQQQIVDAVNSQRQLGWDEKGEQYYNKVYGKE
jgi:hypothetical protein